MTIGVISPVHGQSGTTVVAASIATILSLVQSKETVCLTHGDFGRTTLLDIMGKESVSDMSTNLSQAVASLAEKGVASNTKFMSFTRPVTNNLCIYTSEEQHREQEELSNLYEMLVTRLPYDYTIIDIDTGLDHYLTEISLRAADTLIIVVNQNKETIKRYFEWYTPLHKKDFFKDKRIFYMINKYDTSIGLNMANQLKTKEANMLTLHYNSLIAKLCNEGYIQEVFERAAKKDGTVVEIFAEMRKIVHKLLGKNGNWKGFVANGKYK